MLLCKIADFGLAREIRSSPPYTEYVSTRWYRAPEVLLKDTHYNAPIDIWAMGAIMAEILTLRPLFPGNSEMETLVKITQVLGTPTNATWSFGLQLAERIRFRFPIHRATALSDLIPELTSTGIRFISRLLIYEPRSRLTAAECLNHQWFDGVAKLLPPSLNQTTRNHQHTQQPHSRRRSRRSRDNGMEQRERSHRTTTKRKQHQHLQIHDSTTADLSDLDMLLAMNTPKGDSSRSHSDGSYRAKPQLSSKRKYHHRQYQQQSSTRRKHSKRASRSILPSAAAASASKPAPSAGVMGQAIAKKTSHRSHHNHHHHSHPHRFELTSKSKFTPLDSAKSQHSSSSSRSFKSNSSSAKKRVKPVVSVSVKPLSYSPNYATGSNSRAMPKSKAPFPSQINANGVSKNGATRSYSHYSMPPVGHSASMPKQWSGAQRSHFISIFLPQIFGILPLVSSTSTTLSSSMS